MSPDASDVTTTRRPATRKINSPQYLNVLNHNTKKERSGGVFGYGYIIQGIMTELEKITELDRLNQSFKEVRSVSAWKASTQRYEADVIMNNLQLQQEVRNGTYKQSPMLNFTLNERGKIRDIHAPAVRDRVLQKVINQDILLPSLRKYMIYDNSASLEKRGTAFARKRHLIHLRNFIRNHPDGYILQIDIRHFFDSIDHEIC